MVSPRKQINVFVGTDYYIGIAGSEEGLAKLGITEKDQLGSRKNPYSGAGESQILEIDSANNKHGKSQRQNAISTQQTARLETRITLVETYLWKGRNIHKKVGISFPSRVPVIVSTSALHNNITTPTAIKKFKGQITYKRSPGGRFAIMSVGNDILRRYFDELKTAKDAYLAKYSEESTIRTEPESI